VRRSAEAVVRVDASAPFAPVERALVAVVVARIVVRHEGASAGLVARVVGAGVLVVAGGRSSGNAHALDTSLDAVAVRLVDALLVRRAKRGLRVHGDVVDRKTGPDVVVRIHGVEDELNPNARGPRREEVP